jgi:hypothetical protein
VLPEILLQLLPARVAPGLVEQGRVNIPGIDSPPILVDDVDRIVKITFC